MANRLIEYTNELLTNAGVTEDDSSRVTLCIEAATVAIQKYCHRDFFANEYDETQNAGQFGYVVLRRRPLLSVYRICDSKVAMLQLACTTKGASWNTSPTGITIVDTLNGTRAALTLTWEDHPTLDDIADTINNNDGWTATPLSGFASTSSTDLVAGQYGSAQPGVTGVAQGWQDSTKQLPVDFEYGWVGQLNEYSLVNYGPSAFLTGSPSNVFVPGLPIRVIYRAGYESIPEDLQRACAELVGNMLDPKYGQVTTESLGGYSYAIGEIFDRMPIKTKQILEKYRERVWAW